MITFYKIYAYQFMSKNISNVFIHFIKCSIKFFFFIYLWLKYIEWKKNSSKESKKSDHKKYLMIFMEKQLFNNKADSFTEYSGY